MEGMATQQSPRRRKRIARRRRKEEAEWAAKCGPVTVYRDESIVEAGRSEKGERPPCKHRRKVPVPLSQFEGLVSEANRCVSCGDLIIRIAPHRWSRLEAAAERALAENRARIEATHSGTPSGKPSR
jgi:hypothetical protein